MPITLVGTLPVSGLNLGLAASVGGLTAEIAQLSSRVGELTTALSAQVKVTASFPPNPALFASAFTAGLSVPNMTLALGGMSLAGAGIATEFGVKLGAVAGRLATIQLLTSSFGTGLSSGSLAGWCYGGSARGFGAELERATAGGYGRTAAAKNIQALVVATESFSSWGAFSEGFRTGGTAASPADPDTDQLLFQGELSGGQWNTGVSDLFARFDLLRLELDGQKTALEGSIDIAAGLNLPDPSALVNAGLAIHGDLGISGVLDNLVNVQTDLSAGISGLNTQLALVNDLIADITAQLSAAGLTLWTYSGPASELGAALRAEVVTGLPGGSGPNGAAYGIAMAGSPAAMTSFGSIFAVS